IVENRAERPVSLRIHAQSTGHFAIVVLVGNNGAVRPGGDGLPQQAGEIVVKIGGCLRAVGVERSPSAQPAVLVEVVSGEFAVHGRFRVLQLAVAIVIGCDAAASVGRYGLLEFAAGVVVEV